MNACVCSSQANFERTECIPDHLSMCSKFLASDLTAFQPASSQLRRNVALIFDRKKKEILSYARLQAHSNGGQLQVGLNSRKTLRITDTDRKHPLVANGSGLHIYFLTGIQAEVGGLHVPFPPRWKVPGSFSSQTWPSAQRSW